MIDFLYYMMNICTHTAILLLQLVKYLHHRLSGMNLSFPIFLTYILSVTNPFIFNYGRVMMIALGGSGIKRVRSK